jgi:hypothetical protein
MSHAAPILNSWLSLYPTKQLALDELNAQVGGRYKHNALYLWDDPTRANPKQDVYEYMVKKVLIAKGFDNVYDLIRLNY